MTSPATELRTAAQTLRTLTAAIAPPEEQHLPFHADGSTVTQGRHGLYDVARTETPELAAYIAALGPNVGTLLADWLGSAAEDAEQIGPDPHALAVARQINATARTTT